LTTSLTQGVTKKNEQQELTIETQLPNVDPTSYRDDSLPADIQPLLQSFTTSVVGTSFRVDYYLKLFVKHAAWNEFGEGKVVNFPIKIIQPPIQVQA